MFTNIKKALSNLKNEDIKEQYYQIITMLLEKGYFPGLENIPVAKSGISNINGEEGILTFRGYPVQELANNCCYEDVSFLLLKGDLPLPEERTNFRNKLLKNKEISSQVASTVASMPDNLHPMHMLSSSVLQLQSTNQKAFTIDQYTLNLHHATQLIAKLPTL